MELVILRHPQKKSCIFSASSLICMLLSPSVPHFLVSMFSEFGLRITFDTKCIQHACRGNWRSNKLSALLFLNGSSTMNLISLCFANSNDCGKRAVRQAHHTICTGNYLQF